MKTERVPIRSLVRGDRFWLLRETPERYSPSTILRFSPGEVEAECCDTPGGYVVPAGIDVFVEVDE